MLNGRTELHIFDRGSVIGDLYCEEVLLPHVRLFRGAIGPDFIFMDDNARPHRTLAVEELLESEDITRMDWTAYSPDLNPIEHMWDALGRRIAAHLHHPENTQQLKQMLIEEWALLPQETLHQLVLSMRRRCEATIARRCFRHPLRTKYSPSLNAQAEHAHDSKQSCAKEKKIPDLNESFSSFGDSVGKSGLAITFVLKCFACPYRVEFSSSNFHEGTQIATINTRFVYAMCSIGKGAEAGRMFCGVMNLPQPHTRFSPYGKRILNAAKLVYEDSIQNAAKEAIFEKEGNKNIAVAVDGTWQKRGYTSLNGVVTVTSIDTGKVIDVDILSKYCACKNLPFHEKDCKKNYVGSSGAMEIQGASKIFQRSLSLHNARYITYLGDGDCKAFDAVKEKHLWK
ncbi:uncharacterized protein TNCV_4758141 [Trichonephila clavipes]|nr:uncharacterized protein TNCV_4758141 [Trichonephila clavipes]